MQLFIHRYIFKVLLIYNFIRYVNTYTAEKIFQVEIVFCIKKLVFIVNWLFGMENLPCSIYTLFCQCKCIYKVREKKNAELKYELL
jgi:hypothetical protein